MSGHGLGEGLLGGGEAARVALAPELEFAERSPGPEQIVGAVVLVPGLSRLAKLIPQERTVGILGLPSD